MSLTLNTAQVEQMRSFVDRHVRRDGCDHTHRFTQEWAREESVNWDDLLDILEANGGYCDCEVVMNLRVDSDVVVPERPLTPETADHWLIPPSFESSQSATFTKMIVCEATVGRNTHALDSEFLIPAPKGAKPRRRVRKLVSFFIGCRSGLPSEIGVVKECNPISAEEFARQVAGSEIDELKQFGHREAAFVLSAVAFLKPCDFVGTDFADRVGIATSRQELWIHRVFLRR